MTSFTKALFKRNPAAANAVHQEMRYGKHATLAGFTLADRLPGQGFTSAYVRGAETFGKRRPAAQRHACATNCGHPACSQGCTLHTKS